MSETVPLPNSAPSGDYGLALLKVGHLMVNCDFHSLRSVHEHHNAVMRVLSDSGVQADPSYQGIVFTSHPESCGCPPYEPDPLDPREEVERLREALFLECGRSDAKYRVALARVRDG